MQLLEQQLIDTGDMPLDLSVHALVQQILSPGAGPGVDLFTPEGAATFRQAEIGTDDIAEFLDGIKCGQICFVEETRPITTRLLAALFAEALVSEDPESYNIGFILGLADALLRARKAHPGWHLPKKKKV